MELISLKQKFDIIVQYFKQYSFNDIIRSLFVIALWNDNSSAVLKQIFLFICLISLDEFEFESNDKIFNYYDFEKFTQFLINNLPEFPALEDYCSGKDWGEVKFFHKNSHYKIFYESEICNIYDLPLTFQEVNDI